MSIPVPVPKANRHGEFKTPPHPPVRAVDHLANRPPDTLPQTATAICPTCSVEADHWVKFDNIRELELQCVNCGEAMHVEVTDR